VFQKAKAAEQQLAAAASAAAAAAGADSRQQAQAGKAAPKMDGHVYGALIAACAQAIRVRSSDLREQLVILERAFQVRVLPVVQGYWVSGMCQHVVRMPLFCIVCQAVQGVPMLLYCAEVCFCLVLGLLFLLQVLQEAEDAGLYLETPAWNALLMCAGETKQGSSCPQAYAAPGSSQSGRGLQSLTSSTSSRCSSVACS
jgi:hypothetical protein